MDSGKLAEPGDTIRIKDGCAFGGEEFTVVDTPSDVRMKCNNLWVLFGGKPISLPDHECYIIVEQAKLDVDKSLKEQRDDQLRSLFT